MNKSLIINQIKDRLGIKTDKDFAKYLGINPTTLSMWHKRNTYDAELLFTKCDFLNAETLLLGKGEVFKNEKLKKSDTSKVSQKSTKTKSKKNVTELNGNKNSNIFSNKPKVKKTLPFVAEERATYGDAIPLIPIDAIGGFGTGEIQVMDYELSAYYVPEFTELKAEFMIRVKGSSMYPKYNSGDLVACKKLSLSDIFFQWNKVYVLDTEQGALIKRVSKSEDTSCVKLVSDNKSYEPFDIPISKIYAIAIVVGVIRLE